METDCLFCGIGFSYPIMFGVVKYCSSRCRVSHVPPTEPWEYKGCQGSDYYGKGRRKKMKRGDLVDYLVIYEYYDWVCSLCDEQIDKTLTFPNPGCATMDHRVPLGQGGKHEWMNLYPAHLSCNGTKDDLTPAPGSGRLVTEV